MDNLIKALRRARDEANAMVVDEMRREHSEPAITIWENINACLRMLPKGYEQGK
jgi:hypothetical protein